MTPGRIKQLKLHTPQGYAGELVRESQFVFNYRTDAPRCAIALTMPLRQQSYTANLLPGVLRQNLPEGFLYDWIKARFGKVMKLDDMAILAIAGRDVIGRVRVLQEGDAGAPGQAGESLSTLLTWKGTEDLFQHLAERYALASGISGVQPKVVVPARLDASSEVIEKVSVKDRSLIVKASGEDFPDLAENEYHCMSIAKAAGLTVPAFWLSDDKQRFIVERFDLGADGYLGFEDMTALMNKHNDEKYNGSYEQVAKAVTLFASPAHVTTSLNALFAAVTLSVLLRNGDAHLKNFGLLYNDPQSEDCRLSPLYDVVNTTTYLPKDVLALKLKGSKAWPLPRELAEFGKQHCRVDHPEQVMEQIASAAMAYRPREDSDIWQKMRPLIAHACFGLDGKNLHAPGTTGSEPPYGAG